MISDVAFPEKYYSENFPQRKNICRLFLYLTILYYKCYWHTWVTISAISLVIPATLKLHWCLLFLIVLY